MTSQKFWQWSDDIKPKDDITPFDGTDAVAAGVLWVHRLYRTEKEGLGWYLLGTNILVAPFFDSKRWNQFL